MTLWQPCEIKLVLCSEAVYRRDDWHSGVCDNPASWVIRLAGTPRTYSTVCGVHVRRYRTYPNRYTVEAMQ